MRLQILNLNTVEILSDLYETRANIDYDGKPLWYDFLDRHFSELDIKIDILPFEEIDKTKPWIINATVKGWTWYDFAGDIISSFNKDIQHELINGSAYLLLNHEWESDTYKVIVALYKHLDKTRIPPNKIIYMSGGIDLVSIFDKFAQDHNILKSNQITNIYSPHCLNIFAFKKLQLEFFDYDRSVPKIKKYLFLNRVGRPHRIMMTSMLSYYDLLAHGYVSLGIDGNEVVIENIHNDRRIQEGFFKIKDKLPLIVDTDDFIKDQSGFCSLPIKYYQTSYFSLVSASVALDDQDPSRTTNEKELKPILAKQPFILLSKPNTLKHLRDMGFMTFDKWFDERYDNETDDLKRMDMIALEVKRLSLLTNDQWEIMISEMTPVLRHNYNRAVNYASERCYFIGDLKKFLYYVA
jgi:hypothetical protein